MSWRAKETSIMDKPLAVLGEDLDSDQFIDEEDSSDEHEENIPLRTNRQRYGFEMRYGLNHMAQQTLDSIRKQFGITRERVRQIENQAIRKLRSYTSSKNIKLSDILKKVVNQT